MLILLLTTAGPHGEEARWLANPEERKLDAQAETAANPLPTLTLDRWAQREPLLAIVRLYDASQLVTV